MLFNLLILLDLVRYNIFPLLIIFHFSFYHFGHLHIPVAHFSNLLSLAGSCFLVPVFSFFVLCGVEGRALHFSTLFHCSRAQQIIHIIFYMRCSSWVLSGLWCCLYVLFSTTVIISYLLLSSGPSKTLEIYGQSSIWHYSIKMMPKNVMHLWAIKSY